MGWRYKWTCSLPSARMTMFRLENTWGRKCDLLNSFVNNFDILSRPCKGCEFYFFQVHPSIKFSIAIEKGKKVCETSIPMDKWLHQRNALNKQPMTDLDWHQMLPHGNTPSSFSAIPSFMALNS